MGVFKSTRRLSLSTGYSGENICWSSSTGSSSIGWRAAFGFGGRGIGFREVVDGGDEGDVEDRDSRFVGVTGRFGIIELMCLLLGVDNERGERLGDVGLEVTGVVGALFARLLLVGD